MATVTITSASPSVSVEPIMTQDGTAYVVEIDYGALPASDVLNFEWDLNEFRSVRAVAVKNGVASAGEILQLIAGIDSARTKMIPATPGFTGPNANISANSTSGTNMGVAGYFVGRYARLSFTNGATAQTALRLGLLLLPN